MSDLAALEADLVRAGRTIVIEPPPDDLAARVLTAIGPSTRRPAAGGPAWWRWLRARRRRLVAVIIAAVIIGLTLTPPVRAAVAQWLRIGGVVVRTGGPPVGAATPAPPSGGVPMTLEQARTSVDFPIGVPTLLGDPGRVSVSADHRVVGMDWTVDDRPVHLDQFDGTLSWVFLKRNWEQVTPTEVDGREAAWLSDPHEIVYVDRDGVERGETARISGPCLIWQQTLAGQEVTIRLEGIAPLGHARTTAESLALR